MQSYYDVYLSENEAEGYSTHKSNLSPISNRSPSPSENLDNHPFFREEYTLPYEEFEPIIAQRRLRATASAPSSPAASPPRRMTPPAAPSPRATAASSTSKRGNGRKRVKNTRSKLNLAGLVGGESDSSALTQESGDEGGVAETPRESVITGTDAGTEYAEEEDVDMREASPAQEASPRPQRGRPPRTGRRGRGGSTRGASTRGVSKKKKR
ncbi:hypothetical protein D9613_006107 [Agrocybe pediades]|uniref:Uncharacterized protein n=1 Tax=Agrocybe pediades TaxID=84607 RepID=A0A8H4QV13_9AGAR|nr:hypothetical protein D9613_006107 [Agrocybe pediades]